MPPRGSPALPPRRPEPARAPLVIRRAHIGDAGAAAAVRVRSIRDGYAHFTPRPYLEGLSTAATARRRRAAVAAADERRIQLVATRGGRPVGLLDGGPSAGPHAAPALGEIYELFMDPTEFGSGAAHALFAAGVRALRRRGFTALVLWVLQRNVRARRFYAAHGWRPDGPRVTFALHGYPVIDVRYHSP